MKNKIRKIMLPIISLLGIGAIATPMLVSCGYEWKEPAGINLSQLIVIRPNDASSGRFKFVFDDSYIPPTSSHRDPITKINFSLVSQTLDMSDWRDHNYSLALSDENPNEVFLDYKQSNIGHSIFSANFKLYYGSLYTGETYTIKRITDYFFNLNTADLKVNL